MKKRFTLILFALLVVCVRAVLAQQSTDVTIPINATTFPDEAFRSFVSTQYDTNSNGKLEASECDAVTTMEVTGQGISSLKGVEHFPNLSVLQCFSNQLTSIDVSKNTKLTELWCDNNQLTTLDVSKNTMLETLVCYYNQLTSLDVSKNTKLTTLNCLDNQLTSLDLSNNTELTFLECPFNQLTSLDLSNNTKLEWLSCYNNQLTELTVSGNVALSYIACFGNKLSSQALSSLIASMPTVTSGNGRFYPLYTESGETNALITKAQVAQAKEKGWNTYYNNNEAGAQWEPYPGIDGILINATTFPDEAFRSFVSTQYDTNSNGKLEASECDAVTTMEVTGQGISSLKGVEHFPNLSVLQCFSNQLTSIDVSKNTKLTELNCGGNQLTSIDVSKNTKLTELWCDYNQLTTLDVSKNTMLETLWCGENQLTTLDVSNNTNLNFLVCNGRVGDDDNQLTSLDVTKNTKLKYLYCEDNQLTTLDVSKNPQLESLTCSNNQLTSLNVSKNTALRKLTCNNNQLTDVALQSLVNSLPTTTDGDFKPLSSVEYETNALMSKAQVAQAKAKGWDTYYYNDDSGQWGEWELYPGIDGITIDATTFPDAAFRNYVSTKIDNGDGMLVDSERDAVTEITIEFKDVSSMEGIGYFPNLSKLSCTGNKLTSLDVSENTALTELDCRYAGLTSLDVSKNTQLTNLYVSGNQLTSIDVTNNALLTKLWCEENPLNSLDVTKNTLLTRLDCYKNQLTALDLSKNTLLTRLTCDNNHLTALDLSKNTQLTRLTCDYNQLTALDLSGNTQLTELYVSANQLTSLDVANNTALTNLDCSSNQLTSLDVANNTALNYLDCYYNKLTALEVSSSGALLVINCYGNQLSSQALSSLIGSLPTVTSGFLVPLSSESGETNALITKAQVDAAKAKGWSTYTYAFEPYAGYDAGDTYSVTFVNMQADTWGEDVYIHAWSNESGNVTGDWPGVKCEKTGTVNVYNWEFPVYSCTFSGSVKPDYVMFNNGDMSNSGANTKQTVGNAYIDGATYRNSIEGEMSQYIGSFFFTDGASQYKPTDTYSVGYYGSADKATYARMFTTGKLSTIVLPFALSADVAAAKGKFYQITSIKNGKIYGDEVAAPEAYVPYMFMPSDNPWLTNIEVSELPAFALNSVTTDEGYTMEFVAEPTTLTSGGEYDYYGFAGGQFVKAAVATANPFRAYVKVPRSANAPATLQWLGDDATGISDYKAEDGSARKEVFDLQGRRVENPTRGIYIINGKKTVVR